MKGAPCKGCVERQVGCHAQCAGYKSWREQYDQAKNDLIQRDQMQNAIQQIRANRVKRRRKRSN